MTSTWLFAYQNLLTNEEEEKTLGIRKKRVLLEYIKHLTEQCYLWCHDSSILLLIN